MQADPTSVSAAIQRLRMQVNPDNVLQAHHAFQAEVDLLTHELNLNGYPVHVGLAADESISRRAAETFTAKIQNTVAQLGAYRDELQAAANELQAQAMRYGHTDPEIKASFAKFKVGYR